MVFDDLKGKTAIVAGGSGLIGRAILQGFKDQAAHAVNWDIRKGDIERDLLSIHADDLQRLKPSIFVNVTYPKLWQDHLLAFLKATEVVAQHMALRFGGSIINIASIYGMVAPRHWIYEGTDMTMTSQYAAIKAGIISLSKCLACKYAKHNVRINTISPGGIWDDQPEAFVEKYCRLTPMNRMGKAEDIIGAVLFLASDASVYITGVNIPIDGGFTA